MTNNIKIVSDSSCDLLALSGVPFASVPLHILTASRDYTDEAGLDIDAMLDAWKASPGETGTSCPNVAEWLDAFGQADSVFAVTVSCALSGSYNAAVCAARQYAQQHPGRRVWVLDSRSAGPELVLLLRRLRDLAVSGCAPEEIAAAAAAYQTQTQLLFLLSSVQNLVHTGRISALKARAVGLLGVRLLGTADGEGQLALISKARGEERALTELAAQMQARGWRGGDVVITHCRNAAGAARLKTQLLALCPGCRVTLLPARGLCSYYAQEGGLLVGFEGTPAAQAQAAARAAMLCSVHMAGATA